MTRPLRWDPEDPKRRPGGFFVSAAVAPPDLPAYSTLVLIASKV